MWIKYFPDEAGFYWWKKTVRSKAIVVEVCKCKVGKYSYWDCEINGQVYTPKDVIGYFYSERLLSPKEKTA